MTSGPVQAFAELEAAIANVRKVFADELWQCHETDVVDLVRRQHRAVAQMQFLGLDSLTEAQQRSIPDRQASTSAANWLSGLLRLSPSAATEQVRVAESLARRNREVAAAFAEGEVGFEQTAMITRIVDNLPDSATHDQKRKAESFLLEQARISDAALLMGCRKRLHDHIDPDGTLEREKTAAQVRGATFRNHGDGTQTCSWRDRDEVMAKLKAAMDPLAAPRPEANGVKDERTPAQRRADALADLISLALRGDQLPKQRGNRAHLLVTISEENLRSGRGFGVTATGEDLTAAAIRRIACDAKITPITVDGNGVPLAVGRTRRTVTPAQWCALVIRDKGCIFPGCDRPAGWCQAHHVTYWEDFGLTDVDNMVLLCDHHHDSVHHHEWTIEFGTDGQPQVIPPLWMDPTGTPRRNHYWRPPPLDEVCADDRARNHPPVR